MNTRSMFGSGFGENLGGFLGGLFGNSGKPYQAAMDQYQKYINQSRQAQNPFYNAGTGAIPKFEDWLARMQNPSGFINDTMNQYQESPYAKFQQDQAMRTANNMGSASGLTGSTPLTQFAQQNARDISSQDMNQWLQNVLGINTQYGAGLGNLITGGQGAANQLTGMYNNFGQLMGQGAYGREAGRNQDFWNTIGGGLGLFGNFFGL